MSKIDAQRKIADKIFAIAGKHGDSMNVEKFGLSYVSVSDFTPNHLNGYYLKQFVNEFDGVHLINGKIVIG